MAFGNLIGSRLSGRAAVLAAVMASLMFVGCGGADQTTGGPVEPDPELTKQHDAMREYYKQNPLPKQK
ncbi:hypothetical protein [Paludisphaera sp.]|uniref:hypothetical protein n=1 Tax=Paludisphaera sp. TaxID=2017432 RepID=UPI00301C0D7B